MKRRYLGLWSLSLLGLVLLTIPVHAQTAASTVDSKRPFSYNLSEEVILKGTVSSVLTKHVPGMIMGSHLLVNTSSGSVDASLGTFALRGKGGLQVKVGQEVELTGIMKTIKNKPVFLTRLVKMDSQVYSVRNKRGYPMTPQARDRASRKTAQKGEAL